MKVAVIGAGAMGSIFGGRLAQAGEEVTLVDVWQEAVDTINVQGLRLEGKDGRTETVRVRATTQPEAVGQADLILIFVKCYHTKVAVQSALPMMHNDTVVMTLQNGWGNAARITEVVNEAQLMVGLTYNSGTVLGPGHVQQAGYGKTLLGELKGRRSERIEQIVQVFNRAGLEANAIDDILQEIWSKLALNVCTLPTSALLRFYAGQLIEHEGTLNLMRGLLEETVAVANAQGIPLAFDERWQAITSLLKRAAGAKASMFQDVERARRTEIDVINGAITEAGERLGIPTPYNNSMVWLIKALEENYSSAGVKA